jgi:hypothetical protein
VPVIEWYVAVVPAFGSVLLVENKIAFAAHAEDVSARTVNVATIAFIVRFMTSSTSVDARLYCAERTPEPPVRQANLNLLMTGYNLIIRYKQSKYLATQPPKMTKID